MTNLDNYEEWVRHRSVTYLNTFARSYTSIQTLTGETYLSAYGYHHIYARRLFLLKRERDRKLFIRRLGA